jgi:anti-sigma B factor antagonist
VTAPVGSPWIVLILSGELDISRTEEMDEMAASAMSHQGINVFVDLSAVTFMDSSALRWLLRLQDHIEEAYGRLRVIAPSRGSLVRLLSLTGLEDRFAVFPT